MKKNLLALLLIFIIGVVACKKYFRNSEDKLASDVGLSIAEAKAHFKSIDKDLAAVKSELADASSSELLWSKAIEGNNKGKSFVEVPIVAKRKTVALYNFMEDSLNEKSVEQVGTLAVERVLFFRDLNGDIKERIVTYIGNLEYIKRRKTEIYLNSIKKLQSNFSGYIEYKTIDNKVTKVLSVKNGRVVKTSAVSSPDAAKNTRAAATSGCYTVCSPRYEYICYTYIDDDGRPTIVCRNTYMGETCIEVCDPEDPEPDPDPNPDPDPVPPTPIYKDCAGVVDGTAVSACCGCIGGTTGISNCSQLSDDPNTVPTFSVSQVPAGTEAIDGLNLFDETYGLTFPEGTELVIGASYDNGVWRAVLRSITGNYSVQTRMRPRVTEVAGTFTGVRNFCAKAQNLKDLGYSKTADGIDINVWYTLPAVQAHEDVHVSHAYDAMGLAIYDIMAEVASVAVPCTNGKTKAQAILELYVRLKANNTQKKCRDIWNDRWDQTWLDSDHAPGGPCAIAEHTVVDPIWQGLCNSWDPFKSVCAACK